MHPENTKTTPKYACKECGSVNIRSDFNGYDIFIARGSKLIHVGDEHLEPLIQALFCMDCDEELPVQSLDDITVE